MTYRTKSLRVVALCVKRMIECFLKKTNRFVFLTGILFSWSPLWAALPIGTLDSIDGSGVVAGWALDQDIPSQSISVHFYIEGGVYIGQGIANLSRPDVNQAFNVTGNHGFVWTIPNQYRDGKAHQLFVYAINVPLDNNNPLLWSAPRSFTLAPPGGTIAVSSTPREARIRQGC